MWSSSRVSSPPHKSRCQPNIKVVHYFGIIIHFVKGNTSTNKKQWKKKCFVKKIILFLYHRIIIYFNEFYVFKNYIIIIRLLWTFKWFRNRFSVRDILHQKIIKRKTKQNQEQTQYGLYSKSQLPVDPNHKLETHQFNGIKQEKKKAKAIIVQ